MKMKSHDQKEHPFIEHTQNSQMRILEDYT